MKRFLIILLIVLILFNSVYVPKVYAVGNMIINNPFNRQLIATMIIASGMVFTSTKQLEDSVTSFIDMWNDHETGWTMPTPKDPQGPNTWEAIVYSSIAAGSLVYDVTKGTFKQVLELTEDFVDFVKQYVDMNYQKFMNWLTRPNYWELTGLSHNKKFYFPADIEHFYFYHLKPDGTLSQSRVYAKDGLTLNESGYYKTSVSSENYLNPLVINIKISGGNYMFNPVSVSYPDGSGPSKTSIAYDYGTLMPMIVSTVPLSLSNPVYPEPENEEPIGYGDPNIVDNQEYEYKHNETGTPTIVIPIQSPEADESGYFVPSEDLDDLVDIGAADIANESTDGIIIPAPTPTPSPEPVQYPDLPGDDIATDEDYDNPNKRALYQLKFPFSLPWDIKAVFQLLNAPAKAPRFEIDIIPAGLKDKIGITGETEFIFDMEEFELIGQVTRFFSFIGFCLTLIYITRNIIKS